MPASSSVGAHLGQIRGDRRDCARAAALDEARGNHTRTRNQRLALLHTFFEYLAVREPEMIAVLAQRPDLFAALDVTYPEPPVENSPLFTLPNVFLTPHIAGSIGPECHRMGRMIVDEVRRYLAGEPLLGEVLRENLPLLA